nr:hypothetical protein GCM10020092_084810 [Actinoplanes digitatis]
MYSSGGVDGQALDRLVHLAVDRLGDHLGLADGQLVRLAAHLLDQDGQGELAAALHLPGVRALGRQDAQRDVADQLLVETVLDHAGRDLGALDLADQRRGVGAQNHGDGSSSSTLISGSGIGFSASARVSPIMISGMPATAMMSPGLAARPSFALQALGDQQLGDADVADRPVGLAPGDGLALADRALVHAAEREAAEERRGVQVDDVRLQRSVLGVGRCRDGLQDRAEQHLEVGAVLRDGAVLRLGQRGDAVARARVDDGELDLVLVGVQVEEELVRLVHDLLDPGVGAVDLVDDQDDRQLGLQGLAEHEAGLRQRALAGVDEQGDAVDHGEAALDLAAEVGVAGGVDDVDGDGSTVGGPVADRRVLGENGDALFPAPGPWSP